MIDYFEVMNVDIYDVRVRSYNKQYDFILTMMSGQDPRPAIKEIMIRQNEYARFIRFQQVVCWGCEEDQPNQLAHMDSGGCLYVEHFIDDDPTGFVYPLPIFKITSI